MTDDEIYLITNAGYFEFAHYTSVSLIIKEHKVLAENAVSVELNHDGRKVDYYPTRGAFAVHDNNKAEVTWIYSVNGKMDN